MQFSAGTKGQLISGIPYLFLCLESGDIDSEFEVQSFTGAFNHLAAEYFKGVDWGPIREEALSHPEVLQPIGTIELDDVDLRYLSRKASSSRQQRRIA